MDDLPGVDLAFQIHHIDPEGCPRLPVDLLHSALTDQDFRRVRLHAAPVGEADLVQAADAVNICPRDFMV